MDVKRKWQYQPLAFGKLAVVPLAKRLRDRERQPGLKSLRLLSELSDQHTNLPLIQPLADVISTCGPGERQGVQGPRVSAILF